MGPCGSEGEGLLDNKAYNTLQAAAFTAVDDFRQKNRHVFGELSKSKLPWQASENNILDIYKRAALAAGIFREYSEPPSAAKEVKRPVPLPLFKDMMAKIKKRRLPTDLKEAESS